MNGQPRLDLGHEEAEMDTRTTTISAGDRPVTLINVFTVKPGDQVRLVKILGDATEQVMRHLPGFISANIHRSLDGERVTNYAQWRSREDFEAMLKNPAAQEHMGLVKKLATNDAHLYEVVDVQHS